MPQPRIALLGDQSDEVIAHRAIPLALEIAANKACVQCSPEWIHSTEIEPAALTSFDAAWCVPASPYENAANVIAAIQYVRENNIPFLGTCGGYQHAVLEYAQNVLGFTDAGNTEETPDTNMPLINAMFCSLREKPGEVNFKTPSRLQSIYGSESVEEQYNCGFGVNKEYLSIFDSGDMKFIGFDADGDPRAIELENHPFFIGTAFQPERSALSNERHPLISALVSASVAHRA